jgi:hypothetical protein
MTMFETDLLSDLIDRKRSCLAQLRGMGEKQLELVRGGSMTELLELLAAKQRVLAQLQHVERQLDRFRGDDPEKRHWRTPGRRQECADRAAECEALLAQIMTQEKHSEQELIRRRDEAAARLDGAHTASQARGAYLAQPRIAIRQLDLTSDS